MKSSSRIRLALAVVNLPIFHNTNCWLYKASGPGVHAVNYTTDVSPAGGWVTLSESTVECGEWGKSAFCLHLVQVYSWYVHALVCVASCNLIL